jgi:membrane protein implicated in regulation of membrane protease activity
VADVGERVQVNAWGEDGMTLVRYRGAQWTAELAPGEVATAGEYRIRAVTGNRLVLARR